MGTVPRVQPEFTVLKIQHKVTSRLKKKTRNGVEYTGKVYDIEIEAWGEVFENGWAPSHFVLGPCMNQRVKHHIRVSDRKVEIHKVQYLVPVFKKTSGYAGGKYHMKSTIQGIPEFLVANVEYRVGTPVTEEDNKTLRRYQSFFPANKKAAKPGKKIRPGRRLDGW
jgi:hypothetical protein